MDRDICPISPGGQFTRGGRTGRAGSVTLQASSKTTLPPGRACTVHCLGQLATAQLRSRIRTLAGKPTGGGGLTVVNIADRFTDRAAAEGHLRSIPHPPRRRGAKV